MKWRQQDFLQSQKKITIYRVGVPEIQKREALIHCTAASWTQTFVSSGNLHFWRCWEKMSSLLWRMLVEAPKTLLTPRGRLWWTCIIDTLSMPGGNLLIPMTPSFHRFQSKRLHIAVVCLFFFLRWGGGQVTVKLIIQMWTHLWIFFKLIQCFYI